MDGTRWRAAGMTVEALTGAAIEGAISDISALRIAVFRDFPYLYDGDIAYERNYLAGLAKAPRSVVVIARTAGRIVGASTGMPLVEAEDEWRQPFLARGLPVDRRFYCAESVLLEAWRGMGLGHAFFDAREGHAREIGMTAACFCSVVRAEDHPARPPGYRSNEAFWTGRGYAPLDGVVARYRWRDIGEARESEKALRFWGRALRGDREGDGSSPGSEVSPR